MNADRECFQQTVANKAKAGDPSSLGGVVVISLQETCVDSLCALRIFARFIKFITVLEIRSKEAKTAAGPCRFGRDIMASERAIVHSEIE